MVCGTAQMIAPILRCPNETLTEIFHAYVSFSPFKQYSGDPNCARIPAVVRLSHSGVKNGPHIPPSITRSFMAPAWRPPIFRLRHLQDTTIGYHCSIAEALPRFSPAILYAITRSGSGYRFSMLKVPRIPRFLFPTARDASCPFDQDFTPVSGEIFLCLPKSSLITLLNVRGISFDPLCFLDAVISCPNLEICQLSLPDLSDNLLLGMVELPNLLEMTLQFVGHCGCPEFLDNLILPSLTYLAIEHENPSPDVKNPMPYLPGLVERSPGHFELCVLKLDSIPTLSLCCFRGFLEAVPSLERLELINCSLHIPSLSEVLLVEPHEAFPVLPNLTHLTLLQDPDNAINPPLFRFENCRTTLSEVVYSRWTLPFSDDGFSDCDSDIDFFMHHKELEEFIVSNELLMGGKGIKSEELRLRALESEGLQLDIV
ncbi:hypothetical protein D9757_009377 [Collybiopsis confluens]|uniref:Uncharacterized protein n=1 Tax=Collybiopsis confluens TaxID=2823264 RepID=A0A8H5H669_9AGAR|nr:hypothetical protein D9757_009377 [Collybiopsis confluens]